MTGNRAESDFYTGAVSGSFHGSGEERTQMYRGNSYRFDGKKDGNGTPDSEDKPSRMSARGKEKLSEARREAGERRKFVERKRGFLLFLFITVIFILMLVAIYKIAFVVKKIEVVGSEKYTAEELIEASGIGTGINLYSFRGSTVERNMTLTCPYIKSVEVDRTMPGDVKITVVEDKAMYYTTVYGEYKILSEGLRVLETVKEKREIPEGLVKLKLPRISYSVTGRVVEFENSRRDRGIRDVLENAMTSPLADRLTVIDLTDQFDITMVCNGRIKLIVGNDENLLYKLKTASRVLEDEMFSTDNKIRVDLTTEGKTGVVIDNKMELE